MDLPNFAHDTPDRLALTSTQHPFNNKTIEGGNLGTSLGREKLVLCKNLGHTSLTFIAAD